MAETDSKQEVPPSAARRHPSNIQHAIDTGEVGKFNEHVRAQYGFALSDQFAADLIALVDQKPTKLPKLVASKDPATVRNLVLAAYGDDITEQYATDLIAFVEKLVAANA